MVDVLSSEVDQHSFLRCCFDFSQSASMYSLRFTVERFGQLHQMLNGSLCTVKLSLYYNLSDCIIVLAIQPFDQARIYICHGAAHQEIRLLVLAKV
jgi:hypothetical protein